MCRNIMYTTALLFVVLHDLFMFYVYRDESYDICRHYNDLAMCHGTFTAASIFVVNQFHSFVQ